MAALTAGEKLRIKFRKALRKQPTMNAELDPGAPLPITLMLKPDEVLVVKVTRTNGGHYWFTDRRLIDQSGNEFWELLKYDQVRTAHWMFADLSDRIKGEMLRLRNSELIEKSLVDMKLNNYDRVAVDIDSKTVVVDGLGNAYWPTLHFFWWIK
jgi:hypothetical protein